MGGGGCHTMLQWGSWKLFQKVVGYNSIRLLLHIAAGCKWCYLALGAFQIKQHRNHLVLNMEPLIAKTEVANSKHVLHLCAAASASSRHVFCFCAPNQWPFLVGSWNQFIPQQSSYTFNIFQWLGTTKNSCFKTVPNCFQNQNLVDRDREKDIGGTLKYQTPEPDDELQNSFWIQRDVWW